MVNTGDFGTPARHPPDERFPLLGCLNVRASVPALADQHRLTSLPLQQAILVNAPT